MACCCFIATFSVQPASTANVNCAGILDLQMAEDSQSHARVQRLLSLPTPPELLLAFYPALVPVRNVSHMISLNPLACSMIELV